MSLGLTIFFLAPTLLSLFMQAKEQLSCNKEGTLLQVSLPPPLLLVIYPFAVAASARRFGRARKFFPLKIFAT